MKKTPRRKELIQLKKKINLEYKKSKKKIWKTLREYLEKSSRQRKKIRINLDKLELFNNKFKGKTFIIPGKVLGKGTIKGKIIVVAFDFSETAKEKLKNSEYYRMQDFIEMSEKHKNMVIVK